MCETAEVLDIEMGLYGIPPSQIFYHICGQISPQDTFIHY